MQFSHFCLDLVLLASFWKTDIINSFENASYIGDPSPVAAPIGSFNPRQNNAAAVPRFTGKGADTKSVKAYYFLVSILGVPLTSG